jgi:hypothetical protein
MASTDLTSTGRHPSGVNFAAASGGIVNTTTAVTLMPAVANFFNCIASLQVSHDLLGAVTEIAIRDGAGGTVIWRAKLQTPASELGTYNFDVPLTSSKGNLLEVVTLTAVTGGVYVNAQGFTTS